MAYFLYIDESGDPGRYVEGQPKYNSSSKFFTLAGIVVSGNDADDMEYQVKAVVEKYLEPKTLTPNFKLHYHHLVQGAPPYSTLSGESRRRLADDMFNILIRSHCRLLSVTLDLDTHYRRYVRPADPKAYTLLMMLERFQDFLADKQSTGLAIYERFTHAERTRIQNQMRELRWALSERHHVELKNILGSVRNGEPVEHPILQLADFFAYAVHIKATTHGEKQNRWKSIKSKYYKLYGSFYSTGHVVR